MAGFTTIRDEGGVNFSDIAVKKAIDNKLIKGPRMFVSGLALTSIEVDMVIVILVPKF